MRRRLAIKRLFRMAAEYEKLRLMSDYFGFGALLRYGEDRWGSTPNKYRLHLNTDMR